MANLLTDSLTPDPAETERPITIESRFGQLELDPARAISFPQGLPGFPRATRFALAALPEAGPRGFHLLQSLDDAALGFLVLPLDPSDNLIDRQDLADAAEQMGFPPSQIAAFLIVNLHNGPEGTKVSVNLRAPVLVDVSRRIARQFVLASTSYRIRHFL
jgi:flagellar assembly factor FliW